tara:strand:+ start:627 stop:1004 length:378 start_codon:yes stop_codon:yes gene_type:complete
MNKFKYHSINFLSLALITFTFSCNRKYSKEGFIGSTKLTETIYLEVYSTFSGGVFAGNSYSYYLTDSTIFRVFGIQINHDDESIRRKVDENSIYLFKVGSYNKSKDTLETKNFKIKDLIKSGKWE